MVNPQNRNPTLCRLTKQTQTPHLSLSRVFYSSETQKLKTQPHETRRHVSLAPLVLSGLRCSNPARFFLCHQCSFIFFFLFVVVRVVLLASHHAAAVVDVPCRFSRWSFLSPPSSNYLSPPSSNYLSRRFVVVRGRCYRGCFCCSPMKGNHREAVVVAAMNFPSLFLIPLLQLIIVVAIVGCRRCCCDAVGAVVGCYCQHLAVGD